MRGGRTIRQHGGGGLVARRDLCRSCVCVWRQGGWPWGARRIAAVHLGFLGSCRPCHQATTRLQVTLCCRLAQRLPSGAPHANAPTAMHHSACAHVRLPPLRVYCIVRVPLCVCFIVHAPLAQIPGHTTPSANGHGGSRRH